MAEPNLILLDNAKVFVALGPEVIEQELIARGHFDDVGEGSVELDLVAEFEHFQLD